MTPGPIFRSPATPLRTPSKPSSVRRRCGCAAPASVRECMSYRHSQPAPQNVLIMPEDSFARRVSRRPSQTNARARVTCRQHAFHVRRAVCVVGVAWPRSCAPSPAASPVAPVRVPFAPRRRRASRTNALVDAVASPAPASRPGPPEKEGAVRAGNFALHLRYRRAR